MKIKGRQHGGVKSFIIFPTPLSQQRHVQTDDSTSAPNTLANGSRKPANESKHAAGKCDSCHVYPACKSKDKAKRTMKFRSDDYGVNGYPVGISANNALAYLANEASYDGEDEDDGAIVDYENEHYYFEAVERMGFS